MGAEMTDRTLLAAAYERIGELESKCSAAEAEVKRLKEQREWIVDHMGEGFLWLAGEDLGAAIERAMGSGEGEKSDE